MLNPKCIVNFERFDIELLYRPRKQLAKNQEDLNYGATDEALTGGPT